MFQEFRVLLRSSCLLRFTGWIYQNCSILHKLMRSNSCKFYTKKYWTMKKELINCSIINLIHQTWNMNKNRTNIVKKREGYWRVFSMYLLYGSVKNLFKKTKDEKNLIKVLKHSFHCVIINLIHFFKFNLMLILVSAVILGLLLAYITHANERSRNLCGLELKSESRNISSDSSRSGDLIALLSVYDE